MFGFDLVKGIIFDLDDTLVETQLDFKRLKQEIDCPDDNDILTFIANITCPKAQLHASQVVLAHELEDAYTSSWMPGAEAFVHQALSLDLPIAIVTRNCRQATQIKIDQNNIPIELAITREDAPAKPDPAALLMIAEKWQILPADIAYVGDYIYDIQAAHNASMQAWLFDNTVSTKPVDAKEQKNSDADFVQKLRYIAANTL
jgi:phosphoglycolate phosphatase-like HAD superfamily hydrolase